MIVNLLLSALKVAVKSDAIGPKKGTVIEYTFVNEKPLGYATASEIAEIP